MIQTPLWIKNLKVGLIGFAVAAMLVVWNLWLRDGGPKALVIRLAGGDTSSATVYPAVPWIVVAFIVMGFILVMLGLWVDEEWRKMQVRLAQRRAEEIKQYSK